MIIATKLVETDSAGSAKMRVQVAPAHTAAGIPLENDPVALAAVDAAFAQERGLPAGSLYDYWTMTSRSSFVPWGENVQTYEFEFECFTPDYGPEL